MRASTGRRPVRKKKKNVFFFSGPLFVTVLLHQKVSEPSFPPLKYISICLSSVNPHIYKLPCGAGHCQVGLAGIRGLVLPGCTTQSRNSGRYTMPLLYQRVKTYQCARHKTQSPKSKGMAKRVSFWSCLGVQVMTEGQHRHTQYGHALLCKQCATI